jgi:phosphatidate cytidylyltransferase
VLVGGVAAVALFLVVSLWALREYLRFLPAAQRPRDSVVLANAATVLSFAAIALDRPTVPPDAVLCLFCGAVIPLVRACLHGPSEVLTASARVAFGVLLCAFPLGHLARLFMLPATVGPSGPQGLVALLCLAVMTNDASQYVAGKLAGRHPLAPILSPKKTWEGLAGGVVVTALVTAAAAPLLAPFDRRVGALVGVGLSLLGLLGDLLVSAIKRDVGVKDSGTALPGQGGILDRCDSMLLSAPLSFYVVNAWLR